VAATGEAMGARWGGEEGLGVVIKNANLKHFSPPTMSSLSSSSTTTTPLSFRRAVERDAATIADVINEAYLIDNIRAAREASLRRRGVTDAAQIEAQQVIPFQKEDARRTSEAHVRTRCVPDEERARAAEHPGFELESGGRGAWWVATIEDEVVGAIFIELPAVSAAASASASYGPLGVSARHQGRGYGVQLVRFAEDTARQAGASIVRIESVEHRVDNHEWYLRLGYHDTGERVAYPKPELLIRPTRFFILERAIAGAQVEDTDAVAATTTVTTAM
jgi:predicted N-acetyltransferase YhbS